MGSKFEFQLSQSDAVGLYAVLTGNQASASPEQLQTGNTIYAWFYGEVQRIAAGKGLTAIDPPVEKKTRKSKVA
jgi:hypothetical protein